MTGIRRTILALAATATAIATAGAQAQPSASGHPIPGPNSIGDGRWHWIEVEPARGGDTGWVTVTGTATIRIAGTRFHAELAVDPDQTGADIRLDGRITGGHIRARETLPETDAGPATVAGDLRREALGTIIEERIAFSGGQSGQASFLGLYRRVAR